MLIKRKEYDWKFPKKSTLPTDRPWNDQFRALLLTNSAILNSEKHYDDKDEYPIVLAGEWMMSEDNDDGDVVKIIIFEGSSVKDISATSFLFIVIIVEHRNNVQLRKKEE